MQHSALTQAQWAEWIANPQHRSTQELIVDTSEKPKLEHTTGYLRLKSLTKKRHDI